MKSAFTNEALKDLINSIMRAMKSDFGVQYSKQFANNSDISDYKIRLYDKFDGRNLSDLADGYEIYVEDKHKYPPNLSQLIEFAERAKRERLDREKVQAEIERVNALPAPKHTIDCDPTKMLATAKSKIEKEEKLTTEERALKLDGLMQNHKAILTLAKSQLRKPKFYAENYKCNYSGCSHLGALSDSTRGEGPWYCATHSRMV